MKFAWTILSLSLALGSVAQDAYQRSGIFIGGRTNDTRTPAQKLLEQRGGAPKPKPAPIPARAGTVDWRVVNGTNYQVGVLRDYFVTHAGPRPLPAWDLYRGRIHRVRGGLVFLQLYEDGTTRLTSQVVAVRNWPGKAVLGAELGVFAMELESTLKDDAGQPLLLLDYGVPIDPKP